MEKKEINKLGGSLLVPSVQELAKEPLSKVTPKYVRDRDEEQQHDVADPSFSSQVPIINLSNLCSPDLKASELPKFHSACQPWGFFQVINDGVDASVVERVKKGVKEFFDLTMEEKKKYWQTEEDVEGFVKSGEQKLDWADMFYPHYSSSSSQKAPPLPQSSSSFQAPAQMREMALKLLEAMVEALGMEENEMRELFEEGWQTMRMNYYPSCPEPEIVNGLSPHSDGVRLTILLQVNETEQGLQTRHNASYFPP